MGERWEKKIDSDTDHPLILSEYTICVKWQSLPTAELCQMPTSFKPHNEGP